MPAALRYFELASFTGAKIDAENGVLFGVAVLTMGALRPGDVRTYAIDRTTLEQVRRCASAYTGGLKVKMTHEGTVSDIVGVLQNFRIDGEVLRADLHLLTNSPQRAYVIEIAEKLAASFGLSISARGTREKVGNGEFLRCEEILSCDLVDEPASNPDGLFDARRSNDEPSTDFPMTKEEISALLTAALAPIADRLAKLETATSPETIKAQLATELDASQEKLATKLIATFKLGVAPGAAAAASGTPATTPAAPTKFEEVVLDLKAKGKKHNEAVDAVIRQHEPLYKDYLARVGRGELVRF